MTLALLIDEPTLTNFNVTGSNAKAPPCRTVRREAASGELGKLLRSVFTSSDPAIAPPYFANLLTMLDGAVDNVGDRSFATVLEAAVPQLRRFARSLTRDRDSAEDLVQDTLLKAWAARHRFEMGTNIGAWSCTILRRIFLSQRRRDRFHAGYDELMAERILAAPESQSAVVELTETHKAMERISPDQRRALLLIAIEGLSYEDAAERVGVPLGTLKSRVTRAREALQVALTTLRPPSAVKPPASIKSTSPRGSGLKGRYAAAKASGQQLWIG